MPPTLTAAEAELYAWVRQAVPKFLFANDAAAQEVWAGIVATMDPVRTTIEAWTGQQLIQIAVGVWLDAQGRDRGMPRYSGETDDDYRARIIAVDDAVTEPALEAAADAILAAGGLTTGAKIVSLRMDRAFFWTSPSTSRKHAYLSRGYRMTVSGVARTTGQGSYNVQPSGIILILPYGTTASAQAGCDAMLQVKKAAGFWHAIEVRATP